MNKVAKVEEQNLLPADPMVSMIERVAMDPNVPIERLERMMEMKDRMEAKEAERAFASAFAVMQQEIPVIPERGEIKNRAGEVQSTYPLWEDVIAALREPMANHGFSMSFDRRKEDGTTYYGCILTHAMGHSRRAEIDLPRDTSGSKNEVQGEGSSVSYGQRYSSKMAINWTSEGTQDDDGQAAGGKAQERAPNKPYSWAATVTQDMPENSTPRDKAEAIAQAICAQFKRMKGIRQIDNEWDRRASLIGELETKHSDLWGTVIEAYELRRNEIEGAK